MLPIKEGVHKGKINNMNNNKYRERRLLGGKEYWRER
jgi:hypothetical protein